MSHWKVLLQNGVSAHDREHIWQQNISDITVTLICVKYTVISTMTKII